MRWIVRLAVLVLAVVLGRQLWDRQVALTEARQDLDHQRAEIDAAESEIDGLDRAIDESEGRLRDLDWKIGGIEREYPNGIPPGVYAEYSRLVAEQNDAVAKHNDLVSRQHALHGDYTLRVDRHNTRVAAANSITRENGPCAMLPGWLRPAACRNDE